MTDQPARYDRVAEGYAQWWAPVLAPTAITILDRIATFGEQGGRLLDVGTGTGTLSIEALRRWPRVEVVGIDASGEMAAGARREADRALPEHDRRRYRVETAFADRLPFPDGTFDAAVSSFVLQLVPSRRAVLREIHRVLRPGGRFAHVTWMVGETHFEPDAVVDAVLEEFGYGPRESGRDRGDYESVRAAVGSLRRAGFRNVEAEAHELVHRFDARSYQGFVQEFDEEDLFASMRRSERHEVSARLRRKLSALPASAFELRLPVVVAHGER